MKNTKSKGLVSCHRKIVQNSSFFFIVKPCWKADTKEVQKRS